MRPKGHARVDARYPRAFAICERCGFTYNHDDLRWQTQWVGTKLQNLYRLVCPSCFDVPQEQLRVIVIPPDPLPIMNARPENFVEADNPMSAIGASPNFSKPLYGSRIGNLLEGGGPNAAFDGNPLKPAIQSAMISVSNSSYRNYVGIDWNGINSAILNMPADLMPPVIRHSLTSFTLTAPLDQSFLGTTATDYFIQSSPTGGALTAEWTTVSSGTTAGAVGEEITGDLVSGGLYQFHRVAFLGDSVNSVAVAQVQFNVAQIGEPATTGSS